MRIRFGIIIFIISLTASNLIPFQTFSGTMPGAIYPFTVSLGDSIDGQITVSDPSIPISSFGYTPDFTGVDVSLIPGLQVSTNRYVATIPLGGQYYFGVSVANSAPLYTLVDY